MSQNSKIAIKVYVVMQRINTREEGRINSRVIDTKLTRQAAQDIVDRMPGTWIVKQVATK